MNDLPTLEFDAFFDGDDLILEGIGDRQALLSIVDVSGRVLYQSDFSIVPGRLYLPMIKDGLFFVQVQQDAKMGVAKVVKFE